MSIILQDINGQAWALTANPDGSAQLTATSLAPTTIDPEYAPVSRGLTKSKIIAQANRRTGNRAIGELNTGYEYALAVSDVCEEFHFSWRRKTGTFTTNTSTRSYDLAAYGMTDLSEIARVYIVQSSTNVTKLEPISDSEEQIGVLADTTSGKPGRYMPPLDGYPQSIMLDKLPDAAYTVRVVYYAIPVIDEDDASEIIPLVPPQAHKLIAKKMELNILEHVETEGTASGRYISCAKEYGRMLSKAIDLGKNFSVESVNRVKLPQTAVRSTY